MKNHPSSESIIWLDGVYIKYDKATVGSLSHSLSYATGIFEGVRSFEGKVLKLSEHLSRFERSIQIMGWNKKINHDEFYQIVKSLISANSLKNAYIKILAFLDDASGGYAGKDCKIKMLVACWEFKDPFDRPIKLGISAFRKPHPSSFPYKLKGSAGYLLSYLSIKDKGHDFDDVLFLDGEEKVSECSGSNVFFKINGEWLTPEPSNCLDGITARFIVDDLSKRIAVKARYASIAFSQLKHADAAFTCGTAVGIVPINYIDGIGNIYSSTDIEVNRLIKAYQTEIHT